jgi:DNA-directed RNA polymerase subunit RPC12/RpoP
LKKGTDNCRYAGKRIPCGNSWVNHSDLCAKYKDFIKEYSQGQKKRYKKHFPENVEIYLKTRQSRPDLNQGQAMEKLFQEIRGAREWFEEAWKQYLQYMNLNEATLLERGDLPHCLKFEENKECEFNRHTELCMQYKEHLENLSQEYHELEGLYREWRRDYLSGPAKPVFCYPSSRTLTVPKIFGAGFFKVDFDNSILNLRLDDMPEGQFLSYGFKPWPDDYDKQPADIEITSANIHFIGTRARAGFRFKVKHKQSRLGISQDDIDMLRSRVYPRQAQDNDFLREARKLILENFDGEPEREMRIMTVDLGTGSCSASIFAGRELEGSVNFKVLKGDKLYNADDKPNHIKKSKGLSENHVGVHLSSFAEGARKIAEKRNVNDVSTLSIHDMRRLSSHIRFMLRDWARLNASRITKHAEKNNVDLIVFESLRGFKAPGYDENDLAKKRRLSFFAYGIIRRKVVEKAVERGMRVVTVPYFYSSQVCSKCGKRQENHGLWWKNKAKHKFKCEHCGNEINSDENAARVLGKVFWGEIELPSVKKT